MTNEPRRKTGLSWTDAGSVRVRGYRIEELIGRVSWGGAMYLLLRGELPDERTARLFEAIMVSVIDHGVSAPSTVAAVTVATTGAPLSSAVAAGVLAISKYHGGAIEDCMMALEACRAARRDEGLTTANEAARKVVAEYRSRKERVSGFGHRLHDADPRVSRLFACARELELAGEYVEQAEALEQVLSETARRPLPINADGAIAALLCEMSFPSRLANGIFMIARAGGLVAHVCEEQERHQPLRFVDVKNYEYDGPAARSLDDTHIDGRKDPL